MKKTYIIIIVIIVAIIGMVELQKNWKYIESDIITEDIEREKEENLDSFLKDFYENEPSLISYGDVMDIKYTLYLDKTKINSVFSIVFKKEKLIKSIEVQTKEISTGNPKEMLIENTDVNYIFAQSKRYNDGVLLTDFIGYSASMSNDEIKKLDDYDFKKFRIIFLFEDGYEEIHEINLDEQAILKYNEVNLKQIINKSKKNKLSDKENAKIYYYMTELYYLDNSKYISEYSSANTIIEASRNRIKKNMKIYSLYLFVLNDYSVSNEFSIEIFDNIKKNYGNNDDLSEEEKWYIINILISINNQLNKWDHKKLVEMSNCFINGCKIFGLEDLLNE